jgi:hypothetical protein
MTSLNRVKNSQALWLNLGIESTIQPAKIFKNLKERRNLIAVKEEIVLRMVKTER